MSGLEAPFVRGNALTRLLLVILVLAARCTTAAPPIWEADFGDEIIALTFGADVEESVELSFNFPFAGTNYTTFHLGNNGGMRLGLVRGGVKPNAWERFQRFNADGGSPNIFPFNANLNLGSTGTQHFKEFDGNRAVFTWNEVGTNEERLHLLTFQVQVFDTGKIIFGYNGILDGFCEDLIDSLDGNGILVGISAADEQDEGGSDLSTNGSQPGSNVTTIYELWCGDTVDSCRGRPGPTNDAFDLDYSNVIFEPTTTAGGEDGFMVSSMAGVTPPPPTAPPVPDPPPIWETDFGNEVTELTGQRDDSIKSVQGLSFDFPFGGTNYTSVELSNNGGIQLGSLGTDNVLTGTNWEVFSGFNDDGGFPTIFPFNTDLSLEDAGTIHFMDFGDHAVITWNEVGTAWRRSHLLTFQVQLFDNGKIIFGYNGILDDACTESPGESLGRHGILVGISGSDGQDDGGSDLSISGGQPSPSSTTIYQLWCGKTADSCDGGNRAGPTNDAFDLDYQNVVFIPNDDGGFFVNQMVCQAPASMRSLSEEVSLAHPGNLRSRALNGWFPCGSNTHCVIGRATCEVDANDIGTCTCMDGYAGYLCEPVDECEIAFPCPGGSVCVDMFPPMRFKCVCKDGFTPFLPNELPEDPGVPLSYRPTQCIDENECEAEESPCHPQADCTNTIGSFECVCSEGLVGNGITGCDPPPESEGAVTDAPPDGSCLQSTDCQGANMDCVDSQCVCLPGYAQVGPNCQNEVHCDPGGFNNDCHKRAACQEESGFPGFSCACVDGREDAFEGANGKACMAIPPPPASTDPPPEPITEAAAAADVLASSGVGPHPNRPTVFPPCLVEGAVCSGNAGTCCSGICSYC